MSDDAICHRHSQALMKVNILQNLGLGLALAALPLVGGCSPQGGISLETTAAAAPVNDLNYVETAQPIAAVASGEQTPEADVSTAPAKPVSTEKSLPPDLHPTSALSEMIRLAESGVEEGIMLAYVTNSTGTFSLGSEEIIYLNDVGVPPAVITAMLLHDNLMLSAAASAAQAAFGISSPSPEAAPQPAAVEPAPAPESIAEAPAMPPPAEPANAVFYDALAPYGTWLDVGGYGRCWQPSVVVINHSWRPYCDRGHWVYTDCGWYWLSDYSWGWAPFHYGRWFCHSRLGWCWAPDNVWGPSWVSWRYSNDYCGWAPLPPAACFRPGLGFTYLGRSVGFSFDFGIAASRFTFVPAKNFCDNRLARFALPRDRVTTLCNRTVEVNKIVGDHHRVFNHGIPAERIAAATHTRINPVTVHYSAFAVPQGERGERLEAGGRALTVFRPQAMSAPHAPSAPRAPSSSAAIAWADSGLNNGTTVLTTAAAAQRPNPSVNRPAFGVPRAPVPSSPPAPEVTSVPLTETQRPQAQAASPASRQTPSRSQPLLTQSVATRGSDAARPRESGRQRTAPLIIRGSGHAPQNAAAPNFSQRNSGLAGNRTERSEQAVAETCLQPQVSTFWTPPRSVAVGPRLVRPETSEELDLRSRRAEVQTRWSSPSAVVASEPIHRQPTVPMYEPRAYEPRPSPAPSYVTQPVQPAREMPTAHQAHSEVRPAPAAPSFSPSPTAHANSSADKRGR